MVLTFILGFTLCLPPPVSDIKRENHAAVLIAVVSIERGFKIKDKDFNGMLRECQGKIHDNGVVETIYPSGRRILSSTHIKAIYEIKEPEILLNEDVAGFTIYHGGILKRGLFK